MKIIYNREELAWCAGFLDGEGNFGYAPATYIRKDGTKGPGRFVIQVAQVRQEPLKRLEESLGGKVRGPYKSNQPNRQPYFQWSTKNFEDAQQALCLVWNWLSEPKKEQSISVMKRYHSERIFSDHYSGFGNRPWRLKNFCKRGHDYSNVRVDKDGYRVCLDCVIEKRGESNEKTL